MAPNLLVATQTIFSPHRWFHKNRLERTVEQWHEPVPGTYEYNPSKASWFLIETEQDGKLAEPQKIKYCQVLKRYMLQAEYIDRKCAGTITDKNGKPREAVFFRLDDTLAYVKAWDENGEFIPGPYERWCVDQESGKFRKMLKKDDPEWRSRNNSVTPSRVHSRANSNERRRNDSQTNAIASDSLVAGLEALQTNPSNRSASIGGVSSQPSTRPSSAKGTDEQGSITTAPTSTCSSIRESQNRKGSALS